MLFTIARMTRYRLAPVSKVTKLSFFVTICKTRLSEISHFTQPKNFISEAKQLLNNLKDKITTLSVFWSKC